MGWWKADDPPEPDSRKETPGPPPPPPPPQTSTPPTIVSPAVVAAAPHPVPFSTDSSSSCPVDPKARSIWLQAAQARQQVLPEAVAVAVAPQPRSRTAAPLLPLSPQECSSDRIDQTPLVSTTTTTSSDVVYKPAGSLRPLSQDRETSSIPRGYPLFFPSPPKHQQPVNVVPSNSESETGHDRQSGNWIYPSEHQFFEAVMRKQTTAGSSPKDLAASVSSIIPIHNAVNERAWHMIRAWESDTSESCGGPKLLRFEGKGAGAKSPRAVMKSWAGYTEPFDRHDWTVQRCDGTEVEYVIDFYQGKSTTVGTDAAAAGAGAAGINFYLDVRPKLNSFEGCRMRFQRAFGMR